MPWRRATSTGPSAADGFGPAIAARDSLEANAEASPIRYVYGSERPITYGHHPDYTYNHQVLDVDPETGDTRVVYDWNVNEGRTLAMARETYDILTRFARLEGSGGRQLAWGAIAETVRTFIGTHANLHPTETDLFYDPLNTTMEAKIAVLDEALQRLGYKERVVWAPREDGRDESGLPATGAYDKNKAAQNRNELLRGLAPENYPGVILPGAQANSSIPQTPRGVP